MPYFYKISDMISPNGKYDMKWIKKVLFTLNEFSGGCPDGKKISVILFVSDSELISKAKQEKIYFGERDIYTGKRPYFLTKQYEYMTENAIPKENIPNIKKLFSIGKEEMKTYYEHLGFNQNPDITLQPNIIQDFALFEKIVKINNMIQRDKFEKLYIHITCDYYVENIVNNGFLSSEEVNREVEHGKIERVGNRENGNSENGNSENGNSEKDSSEKTHVKRKLSDSNYEDKPNKKQKVGGTQKRGKKSKNNKISKKINKTKKMKNMRKNEKHSKKN
jgi:hypothetical protein